MTVPQIYYCLMTPESSSHNCPLPPDTGSHHYEIADLPAWVLTQYGRHKAEDLTSEGLGRYGVDREANVQRLSYLDPVDLFISLHSWGDIGSEKKRAI